MRAVPSAGPCGASCRVPTQVGAKARRGLGSGDRQREQTVALPREQCPGANNVLASAAARPESAGAADRPEFSRFEGTADAFRASGRKSGLYGVRGLLVPRPERTHLSLYAQRHVHSCSASGLRLCRETLPAVALAMLVGLSAQPVAAGPPAHGAAYAAIALSATVLPYHRLDIVRQAPTLTVTPADVDRGYVDVAAGTLLRARTNDRQGFTVRFDPRLRLFDRATVAGIGAEVEIGPDGGFASHAYSGRDAALELSYRFHLASGIAPGSYPWPLQVSVSVAY